MISKESNIKSLASALLNDCGYLDMDFVINLVDTIDNTQFTINGEETYLFDISDEGNIFNNAIEEIRANYGDDYKIEINTLIYEILRAVAHRIAEVYKFEWLDDDYEIFCNCLDSHLWVKDEFFEDDDNTRTDNLTKAQVQEIKDICENFN